MRVRIKSIMCTTDFSDLANHAVPYGIALAKEFGAKLYLCHVIELTSTGMYGEAVVAFEKQQSRMTNYAYEQLKLLIGDAPVDWEPLITTGHVADKVSRLAEEKDVDLAISANRGRSGLKRLILGSVTERLMRTLPCPLLIVRCPKQDLVAPRKQEIKFKKVLVGCDFSPDSNLAFEYGISLAQEFQSDLHLAHVIEPPIYKDLLKPAIGTGEEIQQDVRDQLSKRLTEMVPEDAYNWCTPKIALLAGQPNEELSKYAVVQDVDLIVLGIRGRSLVETLFVGSTTARVVRRSSCPVLSVRPTAKVD